MTEATIDFFLIYFMGRAKRKCVFEHAQNAQIQFHPVHAQSLPVFALDSYIL